MSNLKILNLFGNQIVSVSSDTFAGTESNLEYLDLGFNIIADISEVDFPVLKYFNLERNNLKRIDSAFRKLSNVNVLVLRQNQVPILINLNFGLKKFRPNFLRRIWGRICDKNFNPKTLLRAKTNSLNRPQISELSPDSFFGLENLISVDVSDNRIVDIPPAVFSNQFLNEINISGNAIREIGQQTFADLPILEVLDLSRNSIIGIKNGAFDNIPRLKKLFLTRNRMSSYRGDFFSNTGNETDLHTLDVSHNELTYLYPESFSYHPYLRFVDFSHNKFSFFPTQFIRGLAQLETLDLSSNLIKSVDDGDFANLPKLRKIDLSKNEVSQVSENGFQNSSQLQEVDLSWNSIGELKSDTFVGLVRLLLDMSHNNMTQMPKSIFERRKVARLQVSLRIMLQSPILAWDIH
jgi:Leucine-rich repeat (LRR) protein